MCVFQPSVTGLDAISDAFAVAIDGSHEEGTNILPINLIELTPGSARRPTSLTNSWRFGILLIGREAGDGVGPVNSLFFSIGFRERK